MPGTALETEYWYRNLRQTVNFEQAVRAAYGRGYRVFVEVSPHPVLTVGVEESLADVDEPCVVVGSLRRDEGGPRRLLASAAEVHVAGGEFDLAPTSPGSGPRLVELPAYAFQRTRFWMAPTAGAATAALHPFLGAVHRHPEHEGLQFTGRLALDTHPWLADHAVNGVVLLPGAALTELAMAVGKQLGCPAVTELVLHEPLVIPEHAAVLVQVIVTSESPADAAYGSTPARNPPNHPKPSPAWTKHAEGIVGPDHVRAQASLAVWPPGRQRAGRRPRRLRPAGRARLPVRTILPGPAGGVAARPRTLRRGRAARWRRR